MTVTNHNHDAEIRSILADLVSWMERHHRKGLIVKMPNLDLFLVAGREDDAIKLESLVTMFIDGK